MVLQLYRISLIIFCTFVVRKYDQLFVITHIYLFVYMLQILIHIQLKQCYFFYARTRVNNTHYIFTPYRQRSSHDVAQENVSKSIKSFGEPRFQKAFDEVPIKLNFSLYRIRLSMLRACLFNALWFNDRITSFPW